MTEHQKLMLRRHLEAAARHYDERASELRLRGAAFLEPNPCTNVVATHYESLACDAREMKDRLG